DKPAPGAAGVALVGNELLSLDRHALAGSGHAVDHAAGGRGGDLVEGEYAAGGFVALGDQRAPGEDLPHVFHADDARGAAYLRQLPGPLHDHPREGADFAVARLASLGLAE